MARIVVTGATGNVGAEVIAALHGSDATVVAAVRDVARARQRLGDDIEYTSFDFEKPETFQTAFAGARAVFLVRPPEVADVPKIVVPAIAAMKAAGVEHIVFLSLLGVEKNRVVPHHAIEQAIQEAGIDWTFLRASFFMQNLNTTHRDDIRQRRDIFVPAGRGKTSFIDVRDIAAVGAKALTEAGHRRRAYDLTGSQALDYYEVARDFTDVLQQPIRYSDPSPIAFFVAWRKRKTPIPYIFIMIALYTTCRFGLAARLAPDTASVLGRPPITIRQYINDYREVWLSPDGVQ